MDWYQRSDDQLICYRCAMGRLQAGEPLLLAIPRDFVGSQAPDWMQCADCQTIFERLGRVYVPRRDMEEIPAPTPSGYRR